MHISQNVKSVNHASQVCMTLLEFLLTFLEEGMDIFWNCTMMVMMYNCNTRFS